MYSETNCVLLCDMKCLDSMFAEIILTNSHKTHKKLVHCSSLEVKPNRHRTLSSSCRDVFTIVSLLAVNDGRSCHV